MRSAAGGRIQVLKTRLLQLSCQRTFRSATRLSPCGLPCASLPEILQVRLGTAENISFRLSNVGHTYWISRAGKAAFAVAAVLPESPVAPGSRCARLLMIICNPQPA